MAKCRAGQAGCPQSGRFQSLSGNSRHLARLGRGCLGRREIWKRRGEKKAGAGGLSPCAEGICNSDLPVSLGTTVEWLGGGLFDPSWPEAVSPDARLA